MGVTQLIVCCQVTHVLSLFSISKNLAYGEVHVKCSEAYGEVL